MPFPAKDGENRQSWSVFWLLLMLLFAWIDLCDCIFAYNSTIYSYRVSLHAANLRCIKINRRKKQQQQTKHTTNEQNRNVKIIHYLKSLVSRSNRSRLPIATWFSAEFFVLSLSLLKQAIEFKVVSFCAFGIVVDWVCADGQLIITIRWWTHVCVCIIYEWVWFSVLFCFLCFGHNICAIWNGH